MVKRALLLAVLLVAMIVAGLTGNRAYRQFVLLQAAQAIGAAETSSLRGWMTVSYIVTAYDLPEQEFVARLGMTADGDRSLSLRDIAAERQTETLDFVREVQAVIADLTRLPAAPTEVKDETWLDRLDAAFMEAVVTFGYPALGLTLLLGSFGLPVPTGLATTIAGAVSREGGFDWQSVVAIAVAASVAGDTLAYGLGATISPDFVRRHGRWIGYTEKNRSHIEALFARFGPATVLFTRTFASHLSSVASLLAGLHRYAAGPFLIYSGAGRLVWTAAYFGLGYAVGNAFEAASGFLESLGTAVLALAVATAAGFFLARSLRSGGARRAALQPTGTKTTP